MTCLPSSNQFNLICFCVYIYFSFVWIMESHTRRFLHVHRHHHHPFQTNIIIKLNNEMTIASIQKKILLEKMKRKIVDRLECCRIVDYYWLIFISMKRKRRPIHEKIYSESYIKI